MKKFLKILEIGFVTFFIAFFKYTFVAIINNKEYDVFKKKSLELLKICLFIWAIGVIFIFISSFFHESMQERIGSMIFIVVSSSFCILLFYNLYVFFIIWRKLFKERWEKEQS
jgi:protein-S-isoprenylcysteine O-methyltransferase Ste14